MLVSGNWWNEAFIGPALREQAPELLTTAPGGSILIGSAIMSVTFAAGWVTFGSPAFGRASFHGAPSWSRVASDVIESASVARGHSGPHHLTPLVTDRYSPAQPESRVGHQGEGPTGAQE